MKMIDSNPVSVEEEKAIDEKLDKMEEMAKKHNIYFDEALSIIEGEKTLNEVLEKHKAMSLKEDVEMEIDDQRLLALANYLDVDAEEISQETYDPNIYIVDENDGYLVVDEDEAQSYAYDEIVGTFDDLGLEAFTENFRDWILNYAVDDGELEDFVREEIVYKYDEMSDEEIVDECIDNGYINPEDAYEDTGDDVWGEVVIKDDLDIDELKARLIDDEFGSIDDYAGYIIDMFGEDFLIEEINNNPNIVDMEKVVNECIRWDGIAHFLAHYDGN